MNRVMQIILGVVVLVIVAGGSFYGGMLYGQGQAQSSRSAAGRFAGGQPGGYNFGQGQTQGQGQFQRGGIFGQISQIGDGFMLVTDNNGKQTKVQVTDTTLIEKNASVKLTDLTQGETVIVSGSQGSDGSITARSVQVAPAGRFGGPGNGTGNGPGNGSDNGPDNGTNP